MEPAEADSLTVATFNIRNGRAFDWFNSWPLRRRATRTMLRMLNADVVGLQEAFAFQLRYLVRTTPLWDAVGSGRAGGERGERCPILARRRRLEILEHETHWFGSTDGRPFTLPHATFPRIATIARVEDTLAHRRLCVVNTHLDEHRAELRARSAAQLATWVDDTPTIVLGDFNTADEPGAFAPLTARGLRSVLGADAGGTGHGFTGARDGERLDHILVSEHFDVREAQVVTAWPHRRLPSDHWPVRAVIDWR